MFGLGRRESCRSNWNRACGARRLLLETPRRLPDRDGSAGCGKRLVDSAIAEGDHLAEIEQNQQALDAAGHWGVPTMVLRGEPFFGQDRIGTLRWRLDQYGLGK